MSRYSEALAYFNKCKSNLNTKDTPKGQKFPSGTRVRVSDNLGSWMSHFPSGVNATVVYSYKQMFGGDDHQVKEYCLDIDGVGEVSWYCEHQLTTIDKG